VSTQERLSKIESNKMIYQGTNAFARGGHSGIPDFTDQDDQLRLLKAKLLSMIELVKADVTNLESNVRNGHSGSSAGHPDLDDLMQEYSGWLGNLEARTSGEGFATRDFVFNSKLLVSDLMVAEKVPNAGCFWDLFSVLACMSPKRQRGKDKANETYSAKQINPHKWIMICWPPWRMSILTISTLRR
jgi:hypothetical protein